MFYYKVKWKHPGKSVTIYIMEINNGIQFQKEREFNNNISEGKA